MGSCFVWCSGSLGFLVVHQCHHGSEICLFACDGACCHHSNSTEDTVKLLIAINRVVKWTRIRSMRFQPIKTTIMQLTRKRINKVCTTYSLKETLFANVYRMKCLEVTMSNDLKRNADI